MSEQNYLQLLSDVLFHGEERKDRTGVGTRSLFGEQIKFDLSSGFPLLTTKKMAWKSIVAELLWFLHPTDNLDFLHQHDVHIWDANARDDGYTGPVYGNIWRAWYGLPEGARPVDQLAEVIKEIRANPYSRRLVVSAWHVSEIDEMCLPPCHVLFQFSVRGGR